MSGKRSSQLGNFCPYPSGSAVCLDGKIQFTSKPPKSLSKLKMTQPRKRYSSSHCDRNSLYSLIYRNLKLPVLNRLVSKPMALLSNGGFLDTQLKLIEKKKAQGRPKVAFKNTFNVEFSKKLEFKAKTTRLQEVSLKKENSSKGTQFDPDYDSVVHNTQNECELTR